MIRTYFDDKNTEIKQSGNFYFWKLYFLAALVGLLALLLRIDSYKYFYGKYLWAEDGNVFLHQARELGLSAIIKPYAGYLHFYPRSISAISQLFDLIYQPIVLTVGWLIAYFILIHSLLKSVFHKASGLISISLLVMLVALQPNNGEVFFGITNSQWLIGAALCLYTIGENTKVKPSWTRDIFLLLLTLTGPFSVVVLPVLVLKLVIRKDWQNCKHTYVTVFLGASIQLAALLSSDRVASGSINRSPWEWIGSFLKIIGFGANTVLTVFSAIIIWSLIIYLIYSNVYKKKTIAWIAETPVMFLMAASFLVAAGLFSSKNSPSAIVALGNGNRYSWVPYILILTSVFLLTGTRKALGGIIVFLFGFICYTNFHKVLSPNLQFESFSKFSKVTDVVIPIHPQWPTYPGWYISGEGLHANPPPVPMEIKISPETIPYSGIQANFSGGNLEMASTGDDPYVVLGDQISCAPHSHVGLNVYLSRKDEGWVQLFWSESMDFKEDHSLRRWYPSGEIKAQFAFPLLNDRSKIRIDPMDNIGSAVLKKIEIYCLAE